MKPHKPLTEKRWGAMTASLAALLLGAPTSLCAADPPSVEGASTTALSQGETLYGTCVSCHGPRGEGRPQLNAPRVGGLDAAYLARQLRAFRGGQRGQHPDDIHGRLMVPLAQSIPSDEAVDQLAAHMAAMSPPLPPTQNPIEHGAYATCQACHGSNGAGNAALGAPSLLGQDAAYLERQLKAYQSGIRGAGSTDPFVIQMVAIMNSVPSDQIPGLSQAIANANPWPETHADDGQGDGPSPEFPSEAVEAGLQAFNAIYAVSTHPRCANCHPNGDAPLQGDEGRPHDMGITRFSPQVGLSCNTCHRPEGLDDGLAPLPPADPLWSMPPRAMAFEGRSPNALCRQLKDPAANGRRDAQSLLTHIQEDHLLITSWHSGRTPPPHSHEALSQAVGTWIDGGMPCPEEE